MNQKAMENNKKKNIARSEIIKSLTDRFGKNNNVKVLSLCGEQCVFEKAVKKTFKKASGYMIENDFEKYEKAQKNKPARFKLEYGDWFAVSREINEKINCIWADFCGQPNPRQMFELAIQRAEHKPEVFAVTFSLTGRISGGREHIIESLCQPFGENFALFKPDVRGLNQVCIKVLSQLIGYIPEKVVLYKGGKECKNTKEGRTPMVTIIYTFDRPELKISRKLKTAGKFSRKMLCGYRLTNVIDCLTEKTKSNDGTGKGSISRKIAGKNRAITLAKRARDFSRVEKLEKEKESLIKTKELQAV